MFSSAVNVPDHTKDNLIGWGRVDALNMLKEILPSIFIYNTQFNKANYAPGESATIAVNLGNGLTGAAVSFFCYPQIYTCNDTGNGNYTTTFNLPSTPGIYPITVFASKKGYTDADLYKTSITISPITFLYNGSVAPSQGNTATNFQFSANFRDLQAPQYVRTIGSTGWTIDMSGGGNYSDGVLFTANKIFPTQGTYYYYFEARTSSNQILRFPASGYLSPLSVSQDDAGWDLAVLSLGSSYSPSTVKPGTVITINTHVTNQSNSGNTYTNVPLTVELIDPSGNILNTNSLTISSLASGSSNTYTLTLTMPSNAGDGNYQIITKVSPTVDNVPSNNSLSFNVYIGPAGTNEQYAVPNGSEVIYKNSQVNIPQGSSNNAFTLVGINTSAPYGTFKDPSGALYNIYDGHNKLWSSYAATIAVGLISNSGGGYVQIKPGYSVTDGPAFTYKTISSYPGQTINFEATAPSGRYFYSSDISDYPIFKPGTNSDANVVKDWLTKVTRSNNNTTLLASFAIPSNGALGNYIFYITTGYTTSSAPKEHLTRLEINVTAPLPQISTISKYSFSADDQIIITGTNFGTSQKSVRFYNNRDGIILSWTDTQIICKVPNGVQSGDVFVINDNGTSNGIPYNVVSSTGDPIVVQPIPDQSMNQNSSLIIANLNNVFSDPNNDVLVFTATSSSSNITTSIDGGNLILTSNSLATGSSQITVSAVDLDNVTIQDVFKITIINPSPLIEETPVSLASFGNVQVGLNSIPQYYSISGSNLSDNININAPPGFQVSLISSTGFGNSLILSQSGGIVTNTTIYVIFSPNSNGTYSTSITNASTGANTQIVSVKGTGFSIPSIVALPTSLSFGNVVVNTNSSPQSYDVSGTNLTDNITITAPTGYQISLSTNTGFVNAITLPQSDGTVENIPVYVRFCPTSLTNYSGNVLNVSVGATIQSVALTGTGVSTPNAPIIGQITQPICSVATGSVVLSGFPPSETWTITMTPGGVITSGTGTSIVISELAAGTYFFTVTNSSGYISPASADVIINPQPNPLTIQASSIVFSSISNNDMTVLWTRGDGNSVLVVARAGSAVNTDPVNGTLYSANANFGGGSQIGTGNYVVYNGTGSSINLTGLAAGTDYHYAIYEYNTSGFCYKAPALTGNTSTTNTCTPPTTQASSIAFSSISSYYMTVSWTRGSGDLVLVVAREGSAVNAGPLNGSSSIAAANFGYGTQFGTGNYVVYFGNGSSVDLGGLKAGTDYHFAIYECSNNMDFCYKTPALTGDETTSNTSSYPYCLAGSADQNYEYISNVTMGNINQSSGRGNAGYENYTSNSTTMQIGINTFATIDVTYPVATDQILIWIDWNKDNDFDEPGENVYSSSGSFVNPHITANFAPPVGAAIGTTRMRIRLHDASFKSNSTPCGDAGYGEVEDYSINVIPGCSPSSAPAITLTQPNCTTSNGSITISSPTGTGITYSIDGLNYINTTGVFTNVLPGTYTVTARNSGGCISSGTIVTINLQPVTPTAPIVSLVQPTCTEANGTLTVISPTGTGMTYSVNGITFTNTTGVFIVPPGSLATVAAKSAEGCISPITPITINAQPLPPASPVQTTDCSLGSGNATVTVTNPTGTGFQYSLDGGVYQASVTFTGVLNGSHSITVRNSSGCTTTGGSFSVSCGCANGPSLALNSISGSTCGTTPVTVSGNTFSNATLVTITENGAGIVTPSSSGTSPFAFTYTPGAGDAGNTVIITITTDNPLGSPCAAAVATYTLSVNAVPNTPTIGTITQPTCLLPTGSVVLNGLPAGNWTINPGGITGTGSSTTLTGLTAGTYIFTVTSNAGCTSQSSSSVVINSAPGAPTAPIPGTITQPTCALATGSVVLNGLPAGNWTINPGSIAGNTASTTIPGQVPGTYTFIVTNAAGCTSPASINVIIVSNPATPFAPIVGTITQPTCVLRTGSVELNGLPAGNWTINPGGITGTSSSTAITGLIAGTYIYTVTNNAGCTSDASLDININEAKIGYMPKIAVKYNDILICYNLNDSIQSYQWYKDLNLVPDATSQYYQTHKYPGTYYVITTDLGGCENASNSITIEGKKSMSVYPNPASYSIALTFENVSEGGGVVSIYNSAGVKMMVYHVESVKDDFLKEIPIYNLENGIYILKVILDPNETFQTKIVIIK
jgi:hypothetical protein